MTAATAAVTGSHHLRALQHSVEGFESSSCSSTFWHKTTTKKHSLYIFDCSWILRLYGLRSIAFFFSLLVVKSWCDDVSAWLWAVRKENIFYNHRRTKKIIRKSVWLQMIPRIFLPTDNRSLSSHKSDNPPSSPPLPSSLLWAHFPLKTGKG